MYKKDTLLVEPADLRSECPGFMWGKANGIFLFFLMAWLVWWLTCWVVVGDGE